MVLVGRRTSRDDGRVVALRVLSWAALVAVIERECIEDVAFRVITGNQCPDHTTIARFRQRHQDAIAGLFGEVLRLCADAGLRGLGARG